MKEPITKSEISRLERLVTDARDVSILAFTLAALVLGFSIWALGSYQEEVSDYAPIAFSLSLLQTMLAIGAFAGFWMIRGVAINKSKDVAELEAKKTVDAYLENNHEKEVNEALATLFAQDTGKKMLVAAMSDPSVVAALVASADSLGIRPRRSTKSPEQFKNPGTQSQNGKENINELHSEFWDGIASSTKNRFLKPYDEPQFEE